MADREGLEAEQEEENQLKISMRISNAIVSPDDGRRPPEPQISGVLHSLIAQVQACQYGFAEFFVAWQGVLTMAFSGIPAPVCWLKQEINEHLKGIAQENPGSKWPKTSLGCLRDDKTLSLEQLHKLREICRFLSFLFAYTSSIISLAVLFVMPPERTDSQLREESPLLAATAPILVDDLSVVLFANCCLEKTITVATTPLQYPADLSRATSEESAFVRAVLNEFALENMESYHTFTSKPGNRSAHYRNFKGGATVVHFLKGIPLALATFRARVDLELPGMYDWFRDDSLHITVRALF